jgi:HEAT repeat protein
MRLSQVLDDVFKVRPEEARRTAFAFVYLFTAIGAFIVGRVTRTVLFLEITDYKEKLPLMYVLIALTVSVAMYGYSRVERKLRRDQTNAITLVALIVITLGFRLTLRPGEHLMYWAFYIWVEVYGSFLIVQFWTFCNELFHARQAKRLFAVIGGGGVLANVAIGFAISGAVHGLGTENLLFVLCGLLGVSLSMVVMLGREARAELTQARERTPAQKAKASGKVFQTRHVRLIAAVVVLTYLVSTLTDYQFQVIVGDSIPGKDDRSAYFGTFFGVTGILAGIIQFFLTSRILERFGVLVALVLLPLAMLGGTAGILAVPAITALWAAGATKGAENVLRYTVNDSTLQLLYLPVPAHIRSSAKAWIDGILKPLSVGGAGIVLAAMVGQLEKLVGLSLGIDVDVYQLSWIVAAALLAWVVTLVALRKEYLASLLSTLHKRRLNFADAKFQINDEATLKTLESSLASDDMGEVLHALELMPFVTGKARAALETKVAELLVHPSDEVRRAGLKFLGVAGASRHANRISDLLEDSSSTVRAAASLACCAVMKERAINGVHPLLDDLAPIVRSHAIAGLIRYGGLDGVLACADKLKRMLSAPNATDREQAAWVLGEVGVAHFYQPLVPLLADTDQRVRLAAINAAGRLKSPELIPSLVQELGHPRLAGPAAAALASFGPSIVDMVSAILDSSDRPEMVRAHACKILTRVGDARAVEVLTRHLVDANGTVRSAVIHALTSLVHYSPGVRIDRRAVGAALLEESRFAFGLIALAEDLRLDATTTLLADALEHRQMQALARIFGLLALKYPTSTIELVRTNMKSAQAATRGNAVEVLDNLLDKEEKAFLIPLFEDAPAQKKLQLVEPVIPVKRRQRAACLEELLPGSDDWLRVCSAMAVGTWQVASLEPKVRTLLDDKNPLCRETAIVALAKLSDKKALKQHLETMKQDPARSVSRYAVHVLAGIA